ncbi:MAG: hypothetical protein GQ539_01205, partial [Sulfitobacter sp.]|nr:hypothetical protein [Sulfitobacter sp.]
MKLIGTCAAFIGGIVVCYLLFSLGVVDGVDGIRGTQQEPFVALPTYLGFVSVMMTAVTAVLAAVAIGIGVLAAYSIQEIRDRTDKRVNDAVNEALSDKALSARVAGFASAKQYPTLAELEEDFDPRS